MFTKYAKAEIIDHSGRHFGRIAGKKKVGSFEYEAADNEHQYLHVAVRACTADVPNLNDDMLPSSELKGKEAYKTFIGSYNYLNHENTDPTKARGVIIDAKYHDEDKEEWVETLIEMDEEKCPKLCSLIRSGEIDTVSMGCSVESTTCSVCGNVAEYPFEYCEHIQQKGREFNGKRAYEICNGIDFFELSWVYDPADPTAYVKELEPIAKAAGRIPSKRRETKTAGKFGSVSIDDFIQARYMLPDYGICANCMVDGAECELVIGNDIDGYYWEMTRFDNQRAWLGFVDDQGTGFANESDAINDFNMRYPNASALSQNRGASVRRTADDNESSFANEPRRPDDIPEKEDREPCPLCGSDSFDGDYCNICGYQVPPDGFGDINLESDDDYESYESESDSDEENVVEKKNEQKDADDEDDSGFDEEDGEDSETSDEKLEEESELDDDYDSFLYEDEDDDETESEEDDETESEEDDDESDEDEYERKKESRLYDISDDPQLFVNICEASRQDYALIGFDLVKTSSRALQRELEYEGAFRM